jgi:hypothetical protein
MINEKQEKVINHLVKMTLSREDRHQLQQEIGPLKRLFAEKGIETAKLRLERPPYNVDNATVLALANDYCDRLYAGVDTWTPADRDEWIEVCQFVTELTSSNVQ